MRKDNQKCSLNCGYWRKISGYYISSGQGRIADEMESEARGIFIDNLFENELR